MFSQEYNSLNFVGECPFSGGGQACESTKFGPVAFKGQGIPELKDAKGRLLELTVAHRAKNSEDVSVRLEILCQLGNHVLP